MPRRLPYTSCEGPQILSFKHYFSNWESYFTAANSLAESNAKTWKYLSLRKGQTAGTIPRDAEGGEPLPDYISLSIAYILRKLHVIKHQTLKEQPLGNAIIFFKLRYVQKYVLLSYSI